MLRIAVDNLLVKIFKILKGTLCQAHAMTTQSLSSRLYTLLQAHKQTTQLITRLSKLPVQPGSSASDPSEGDARLELSEEIHQSLKEQEEELELLRQEVEDLTNTTNWASGRRRDSEKDREKNSLAAQVARFGEDLKTYDAMSIISCET